MKTQQSTAQTSIATSTTESSPPSPHAASHAEAPSTQPADFLETLFDPLLGRIEVRPIRPDVGEDGRSFHDSIESAREAVNAAASTPGVGVYVGVATRKPGATRGTKGDLHVAPALWVDIDPSTEEERAQALTKLRSAPQPPGLIINSGGGLHVYWRLEVPYRLDTPESRARFESILRGLCDAFGGDRAATDASRILRVPGTINYPNATKRAKGRKPAPCKIIENAGHIYNIEDFSDYELRGRASASTQKAAPYESRPWGGKLPERVRARIEKCEPIRKRFEGDTIGLADTSASGIDYSLAMMLALAGHHGWEIEHTLRARRATLGGKSKSDGYYHTTVGKVLHESAVERGIVPRNDVSQERAPEVADVPSTPRGPSAPQSAFALNDLGNAARFARDHRDHVQYVGAWKCWVIWDGRRWTRAEYGVAESLGRETVRKMYDEVHTISHHDDRAKLLRHLADLESHRGFGAMMDLARTQDGIPRSPIEFDSNHQLFNLQNGTLDLRTMELRPHDPADLITKLSPVSYDPHAQSEEWERIIEQALPDPELRAFFARCVGYSLGGDLIHDAFFFVYGPTGAMKSTTMGAIESMMGDYTRTTEFDTFLRRNDVGGTRPGLAKLPGVRMALCAEVEGRRSFNVGLVKAFTGGDLIECHGKYEAPFTYRPQARLWLMANDLPRIPHGDEAMWRRLKMLPFLTQVKVCDEGVKLRLRDPVRNGTAILNWALRGRADWEARGRKLDEPRQVTVAGDGYKDAMDTVSTFIDDRCEREREAFEASTHLLEAYNRWALERGFETMTAKAFGSQLRALGFEPASNGTARGWRGLRLVPVQPD